MPPPAPTSGTIDYSAFGEPSCGAKGQAIVAAAAPDARKMNAAFYAFFARGRYLP
jgi:hypothetical protein